MQWGARTENDFASSEAETERDLRRVVAAAEEILWQDGPVDERALRHAARDPEQDAEECESVFGAWAAAWSAEPWRGDVLVDGLRERNDAEQRDRDDGDQRCDIS